MKINETHLIVLKQTKDKSKVYIEYLNIVANDLVSEKVTQFDVLYREADFHSLIA
jgi:hypothetical protein